MLLNVSVSSFMTYRSSGKRDCKGCNIFSAVLDRSIKRAIFLRVKCIKLMKESHKQVNYEQKILWYLDFVSLWNKYKRKTNNKVFSQSSSPNFFLPLIIRSIVFWGSFPSLLLFDFFSYFSTLLQHISHIFLLFHGAFLEGHSDISNVNPQSRQSG